MTAFRLSASKQAFRREPKTHFSSPGNGGLPTPARASMSIASSTEESKLLVFINRPSHLQPQIERLQKRQFELFEFRASEPSNIPGKLLLQHRHEFVAMNTGFVLQPFLNADPDLRRKPVMLRTNRSADHSRKTRIDHQLSTNNDENSLPLRIEPVGPPDKEKIASTRLFRNGLKFKCVGRFLIQPVGVFLIKSRVARTALRPFSTRQIVPSRPFQKTRPVSIRLINLRQQFFRECN